MSMQHDDPDLPLLQQIAAGDKRALAALYDRHGPYVLNYLVQIVPDRPTAEEVLQNVMLAVWTGAGRFRQDCTVRAWVFAIARKQAAKALRDQSRRTLQLDETLVAADHDPQQATERNLQAEALQQAILKLPRIEREALELVYYRNLTLAEAATHLRIPINTLKSRLFRARARLRKQLSEQEADYA